MRRICFNRHYTGAASGADGDTWSRNREIIANSTNALKAIKQNNVTADYLQMCVSDNTFEKQRKHKVITEGLSEEGSWEP
ncbi:hypothetical protein H920_17769 [Fukomys damarensis]|uniref:Uncharacterized protein n=1 Tax=Fukomys damarensis TaxID=885580 RepID=A0A091CSJ3_FUKDA|nr:hypothetical protein H920_17769 [Fukomys damarensis]